MIATIHQPDFLPWFGFFNKLAKADTWIVLDHVENNPRDAAFWGRRVRILVNGRPTWLSIPLNRPPARRGVGLPIREITINRSDPRVFEKCLKTVRQAYAHARHFEEHKHLIENYFESEEPMLVVRNMAFIQEVLALLGIKTRVVFSSQFGFTSSKTELLVELLRGVGASTYLCGEGAKGYQEDALFQEAGIRLVYNRYEHPVYKQVSKDQFVAGLSILDALFCVSLPELSTWVKHS